MNKKALIMNKYSFWGLTNIHFMLKCCHIFEWAVFRKLLSVHEKDIERKKEGKRDESKGLWTNKAGYYRNVR